MKMANSVSLVKTQAAHRHKSFIKASADLLLSAHRALRGIFCSGLSVSLLMVL